MDAKYWKEKANAYAKEQNGGSAGSGIIQESYIAGITGYQKSLREAIEKEMQRLEKPIESKPVEEAAYYVTVRATYKEFLELLDTVSPT